MYGIRTWFLPSQVLNLSADVLRHVPEQIDYEATAKLVAEDMNPLNVVLLQEVSGGREGRGREERRGR